MKLVNVREGCKLWYHPECVGLDVREYNRLSKSPEENNITQSHCTLLVTGPWE